MTAHSRPIARSVRTCLVLFILALVLLSSFSGHAHAQSTLFTEFSLADYSIPYDITTGPDGNLWFTEEWGRKIGRMTPAGTLIEFNIPVGSSPFGITSGPDGNLWFTEASNHIGRITLSGTITEFPLPTRSTPQGYTHNIPQDITTGPDGNLWFTERIGDWIGRITPNGAVTEFPIPNNTGEGLYLWGITAGPDGNIWFTEQLGNNIGRITPDGAITKFPIPTSGSGPQDITTGPDGNLWFTEYNTGKIGRISLAGAITEFAIPTSNSTPWGITSGPDGNLWFTERGGIKIGRITTNGTITEYPLPIWGLTTGITAGPDGNIWFTERDQNKIGRVNLAILSTSGIDYHIRDDFHVFKIDMLSPNLSFEMVMANDVTSVNYGKPSSSPREYVRDMVTRAPYVSRNPVLVFNADYFGNNPDGTGNHGPEGLSVKNGSRFDGQYAYPPEADTDRNEWGRSSLSISTSKIVRIGKLDACNGKQCFGWMPTSDYDNTVGGGPLFIDNGERIGGVNSVKPCRNEKLPNSYCNTSFKWTAAGITQDGRYIILVVSDVDKSMDQAAAVLIAEGTWKAIKFDGGASTQVWYKSAYPQSVIGGGRPVANALVVFSSP